MNALMVATFGLVLALNQANFNHAQLQVQDLIRILTVPEEMQNVQARNGFSWSNCGSPGDPVQLKNLTLSPDPIKLPGDVTASAGAEVGVDLDAPLAVSLKLKKKIFGVMVEIPCLDNIGSCDYDDICPLLQNITCPPELKKYGIPCHCPIRRGSYYLPATAIAVALPPSVPTWLESGDYEVEGHVTKNGKPVACIHVTVDLKT